MLTKRKLKEEIEELKSFISQYDSSLNSEYELKRKLKYDLLRRNLEAEKNRSEAYKDQNKYLREKIEVLESKLDKIKAKQNK